MGDKIIKKKVIVGINKNLYHDMPETQDIEVAIFLEPGEEFETFMLMMEQLNHPNIYVIPQEEFELCIEEPITQKYIENNTISLNKQMKFEGNVLEDSRLDESIEQMRINLIGLFSSELLLENLEVGHPERSIEISREVFYQVESALDAYLWQIDRYHMVPTQIRRHIDSFSFIAEYGKEGLRKEESNRIRGVLDL